jgi:hypothetical protein
VGLEIIWKNLEMKKGTLNFFLLNQKYKPKIQTKNTNQKYKPKI